MKYGILSGNTSINRTIYRCFDYLSEVDQKKFAKKFTSLPETEASDDERMHTFRELIIGAYIAKNGHVVASEKKIEGKTPDWCVLDESGNPAAIAEIVTFHLGKGDVERRLYATIEGKFTTYKELADRLSIPYIVGVHIDFDAQLEVERSQMIDSLFNAKYGLFSLYPQVSGAIVFVILRATYHLSYFLNPFANRDFVLPDGAF